jgi:hypothetical protein
LRIDAAVVREQFDQPASPAPCLRNRPLHHLLTHHSRVDAQRFYERLGFARSHIGMTIRF